MNKPKKFQNQLQTFLFHTTSDRGLSNGKKSSHQHLIHSSPKKIGRIFERETAEYEIEERFLFNEGLYKYIIRWTSIQQKNYIRRIKLWFLGGSIIHFVQGLVLLFTGLFIAKEKRYRIPLFVDFFKWSPINTIFMVDYNEILCVNLTAVAASAILFTAAFYIIQYGLLHHAENSIPISEALKAEREKKGEKGEIETVPEEIETIALTEEQKKEFLREIDIEKFLAEAKKTKKQIAVEFDDILFYDDLRDNGVNIVRFIQFSITFGLVIWVVAQIVGVNNLFVIVMLWLGCIAFAFAWLIAEYWNKRSWIIAYFCSDDAWTQNIKKELVTPHPTGEPSGWTTDIINIQCKKSPKPDWDGFIVLIFLGAAVWGVVTTYFAVAANSNPSILPKIVWLAYFIVLVLRMALLVPLILRIHWGNRFDYTFEQYEKAIMILDSAALTLLAWLVFAFGLGQSGLGISMCEPV